MSVDKKIADALGVEPTNIEIVPPKQDVSLPAVVEPVENESQEDFDLVRETLRDLMFKGKNKIDELGSIATESEKARDFEVYGKLIETVTGLSKDLYDLHKKKKELNEHDGNEAPSQLNIDKAVFVGTTAELLKQVKDKKQE